MSELFYAFPRNILNIRIKTQPVTVGINVWTLLHFPKKYSEYPLLKTQPVTVGINVWTLLRFPKKYSEYPHKNPACHGWNKCLKSSTLSPVIFWISALKTQPVTVGINVWTLLHCPQKYSDYPHKNPACHGWNKCPNSTLSQEIFWISA